jgi:hypothetical protein
LALIVFAACSRHDDARVGADSSFARLQQRGEMAMGVNHFVHATSEVPGTSVMKRLRADITYSPRDLPGGGEVVISSRNPDAVAAIHEFLAFQRMDHHAGMH